MTSLDAKLAACRERLNRFARQLLPAGERSFASDVVQEAYRAACYRAQLIEAMTSEEAYAWLRAMVRNQARNHCRSARRLKRDRGRECQLFDAAAAVLADDWPSPDNAAGQAELNERIDRALASLSSGEQQTVVILHYFVGWSQAEIGDALLRDRTAVSKMLARGLRHLKKCGLLSPDDLETVRWRRGAVGPAPRRRKPVTRH